MNFNAFEPGVLIYTFYLFLLLLVTVTRYQKSNKKNASIFFFFVLLQILIGGLRSYTVGTDTGSYVETIYGFEDLNNEEIIKARDGHDPYFYLFINLVVNLLGGYTWLFFILQITWWGLVSTIYYKYSKSCLIALLILVAFRQNYFALSAMRQGMAMAFVVFSFKYLEARKLIKYFITIVIAAAFHLSAILFIPLYFIQYFHLNKKVIIFILLILSLGLVTVLPNINFSEDVAYSQYLNSDSKGNYFSFITITLAFLYIMANMSKVHLEKRMNLLFNLSLVAMLTSFMGLYTDMAYRIAAYFCMFIPIIMANLIKDGRNQQIVVITLSFLIMCIYIITGMPPGLDDYKFFWETKW